jgi:Putative auto-transporter adhesin, head GIN domain
MKTVFISLALLALSSGVAGADTRSLADFTSVSASGGTRVELAIGPAFSVEVEGRDADRIITRVAAGRLVIEPVRDWRWGGRRDALVRVAMPSLAGLDVSSGARLNASGVDAEALALDASSGAQLKITGLCRAFSAEASSGAHIDARALQCASGGIDASSGANVAVFVTGRLDVEASSGAQITTNENAEIGEISLSSGGSLRRR